MKSLITFLWITFVAFSCKSQILPLNTWMENTPNNAHLKDLGNELAPYVGIYKANYKGNATKN